MFYEVDGMDQTGREFSKVVDAASEDEAEKTLRQEGLFVTRIVKFKKQEEQDDVITIKKDHIAYAAFVAVVYILGITTGLFF